MIKNNIKNDLQISGMIDLNDKRDDVRQSN